ncbi:MAG: hypothetical protein HKL95_09730 [Phycisphaerae bacterium]|nr:hypothetical protein [Phycisphaerae bacterium]
MLSFRSILISASLVALGGVATSAVSADIIQTFAVANANVGDGTNLADATIAFDVSAANNTVVVTISNASVMHAANELLRSVSFDVQTSGGTAPSSPSGLALSDGQSVTVASGGAATTTSLSGLSALGGNEWTISPSTTGPSNTSTFLLSSSGPKYLVIGPSPYIDANSSVAGNPSHSVFLGNSPVFTFHLQNLAAADSINHVVVGFGTGCDVVSANLLTSTTVPEASTLALLAVGSSLLLVSRRRPRPA